VVRTSELASKATPPTRLCSVFGVSDAARVEAILRDTEYVFARDRHLALAQALTLPSFSVDAGYDYVSRGEPVAASGGFEHSVP
jgi:hypothetical protein